jgi:multidrug resistance efflux pump
VAVWNARRQTGGAGPGVPVARTAKVFAGPFQQTLRVSGTVGAKNFAAIVAPQMRGREGGGMSSGSSGGSSGGGGDRGSRGSGGGVSQLILMKLAAAGTQVKKGDVIAQFDSQWELEHIDSHRASVNQTQALVDKRKAEIAIESQTIQQQLRQAFADSEKAKLDLKTAEVRSAIDAEKLKLAVEETAARYKQFQEDVKLKKLSQESELKVLQMQVQQEQHHVDRHNRNIERMTIRAPIDGLVVMQSIFRSGQFGQIQEGDQVYPGTYFMQIVDLSQMIVNGSVNQVNSHSLSLGQKATIRLEAYPDLALPGRVLAVGAMASGGARGYRGSSRDLWVKQIPVRFAIDARDARVIPDLSASADVVLHQEEKGLQVPRNAVVEENGKAYVKVRQGETWQRREIQTGRKSGTHFIVLAGLAEGDAVSLEP